MGRSCDINSRFAEHNKLSRQYAGVPLSQVAIIGPFHLPNRAETEFNKILQESQYNCKLNSYDEWFHGKFDDACRAALDIKSPVFKPYFSLDDKFHIGLCDYFNFQCRFDDDYLI